MAFEKDLNLDATALRLGLPGTSEEQTSASGKSNKRALPDMNEESVSGDNSNVADARKCDQETAPPSK